MRAYTRLCREPQSGPYNVWSALVLVQEGLLTAPGLCALLKLVAAAEHPVTTAELVPGFGQGQDDVSTGLVRLIDYEMVTRHKVRLHTGGAAYRYTLSPFGHMVMEHTDSGRGGAMPD